MAESELVLIEPQIRGIAYPEELIDVTKAYLLEARAKSTREAKPASGHPLPRGAMGKADRHCRRRQRPS